LLLFGFIPRAEVATLLIRAVVHHKVTGAGGQDGKMLNAEKRQQEEEQRTSFADIKHGDK